MRKILFIVLFLTVSATLRAADIDTLKVFSVKMQREIPTVVVTPERAEGDRFPVVYLLHGYGGDELAWQRIRDLRPLAEQFRVIFVCPDGENSWYWDSPLDPTSQFETFISRELPAWVDARYPTIPAREARAIAGLSMGGHGALWTALRHKDLFGAVASVSGGVDIRPFPDSWEMKKQLGEEAGNQERWNRHTVCISSKSVRNCTPPKYRRIRFGVSGRPSCNFWAG